MSEAQEKVADAAVAIHEAALRAIQLLDEIDGAVRELKGLYDDHVEYVVVADAVSVRQTAGRGSGLSNSNGDDCGNGGGGDDDAAPMRTDLLKISGRIERIQRLAEARAALPPHPRSKDEISPRRRS